MNLPDYNFLSAPLWLITVLHILTLSLHFLAMNFLVGGIVIVLWGKFKNRWDDPIVKKFIRWFPTAMAATVTLGVAPLLFVQLTYHKQIYAASIISGWFWLAVIAAVIVAYYFLYSASFCEGGNSPKRRLFLTIALVFLVYVSFAYSSIFSLAETPDRMKELYAQNQSGALLSPYAGDYLFRWLHMLFGALTVGGFFVGWLGKDSKDAYQAGRTWFLWGMVAASIFGLAYIFTMGDYLVPFMRTPAVWVLLVAIILSVGSLHFFFKRKFTPAGLMVFLSLVGMVINRHYVRVIKLDEYWDPSTMAVKPAWSIFVVFLICFVAALGAVWWMIQMYQTDTAKARSAG